MRDSRYTPLRILNEPSGFLGLSSLDLCILGYSLIIIHGFLDRFGLGLLAFVAVILGSYLLIAIRLKFRRKIIRDFIFSAFGTKVIHDPETAERF